MKKENTRVQKIQITFLKQTATAKTIFRKTKKKKTAFRDENEFSNSKAATNKTFCCTHCQSEAIDDYYLQERKILETQTNICQNLSKQKKKTVKGRKIQSTLLKLIRLDSRRKDRQTTASVASNGWKGKMNRQTDRYG